MPERSIASQSVTELGGRMSVLARQRKDHEVLDQLMARYRSTMGEQRQAALHRIIRLAFSHAFAEEAVLWPAIRRITPDGEALTLRIEREHQQINELTAAVERAGDGTTRDPLVDRLFELITTDVRDEEDLVLPRLQQALDPPALRRLGLWWEVVRRTAPTRPHPMVARRPPGNVVAALPLTLLDRSRDGLERAARATPGPFASAGRAASRSLAAVAGAVERLPRVRRGDPITRPQRTEEER